MASAHARAGTIETILVRKKSYFFGWGVFSGKRFSSKGVSTLSTVWLSQFKTIYWMWTISFKLANECAFLAPTVDWWRTLSVPRVEPSNTVLFWFWYLWSTKKRNRAIPGYLDTWIRAFDHYPAFRYLYIKAEVWFPTNCSASNVSGEVLFWSSIRRYDKSHIVSPLVPCK